MEIYLIIVFKLHPEIFKRIQREWNESMKKSEYLYAYEDHEDAYLSIKNLIVQSEKEINL